MNFAFGDIWISVVIIIVGFEIDDLLFFFFHQVERVLELGGYINELRYL